MDQREPIRRLPAPPSLAISCGPYSNTSNSHFPDGPPLAPNERNTALPPFRTLENIPGCSALNIQARFARRDDKRGRSINCERGVAVPLLFTSVKLLFAFDLARCFRIPAFRNARTICKGYCLVTDGLRDKSNAKTWNQVFKYFKNVYKSIRDIRFSDVHYHYFYVLILSYPSEYIKFILK